MLESGECDGQILDREPGRVECRDLLVRAPALLVTAQYRPELGRLLTFQRACFDRVHELAVVTRLLPVVAEDPGSDELLDRDLRLPWAVGAHQAHVLPRQQRTGRQQ